LRDETLRIYSDLKEDDWGDCTTKGILCNLHRRWSRLSHREIQGGWGETRGTHLGW